MRTLAFALLARILSACAAPADITPDTDGRPAAYVVTAANAHTVRLVKLYAPHAGAVHTVARDSLGTQARAGYVVRPCSHPVPTQGARVVTWCIDHAASGIK